MKTLLSLMFTFVWMLTCNAQSVSTGTAVNLTLSDGQSVVLFSGFDDESRSLFYYLPTNLRLSIRKDHTPEFSFVSYALEEDQPPSGAIMHFLVAWGLTQDQESEVNAWLRSNIDTLAMLAGQVPVQVPADFPSVRFVGKGTVHDILASNWSAQPVAPVLAGTKLGISYRLNAEETKAFEEALLSPDKFSNIHIELIFSFTGGSADVWYREFKTRFYHLSTDMRSLLSPLFPYKPGKG